MTEPLIDRDSLIDVIADAPVDTFLADAVLAYLRSVLTPEALDESDPGGWFEFHRMPENTTHIARVNEAGEVYEPDTGWTDGVDIRLAEAKGHLHRLVRVDRLHRRIFGEDK